MSGGLRVWDESGVKILDTRDRVSRIFGIHRISGQDGSITLPPHISSRTFAAFQRDTSIPARNGMRMVTVPIFSNNSTTISWYYPLTTGVSGQILDLEKVGGWLTYGAY